MCCKFSSQHDKDYASLRYVMFSIISVSLGGWTFYFECFLYSDIS